MKYELIYCLVREPNNKYFNISRQVSGNNIHNNPHSLECELT